MESDGGALRYLLAIVMVLCAATVFAASGDYVNPTANYDEGDWTKTDSIYASDNNRASNAGTNTHRVGGKTFGISVTDGATIDSITVRTEGSSNGNSANRGVTIQLSKDGGGTRVGDAVTGNLNSTLAGEAVQTWRGTTNGLWGTTWTEAEVESANFCVTVKKNSTSGTATYLMDHIQVAIWWTGPGGAKHHAQQAWETGE